MSEGYKRIRTCTEFIRTKTELRPKVAIVLGSGLGDFAESIDVRDVLYYSDIPGFPVSGVTGHAGRFIFGYQGNLPVVIMQGRVHYYEGYSMEDVVLPIRVMGELGADTIILTNAAGGVNTSFKPGDLMMITDQIATFVPSPLRGENIEELGERFSDMTHIYDEKLQRYLRECGKKIDITLQEGVYIQFSGPSYETPQEIRMSRILGADAVGMSTACEAIAANHMGMEICGISCITNMASGITEKPLSHDEVKMTSLLVKEKFGGLLRELLRTLENETWE